MSGVFPTDSGLPLRHNAYEVGVLAFGIGLLPSAVVPCASKPFPGVTRDAQRLAVDTRGAEFLLQGMWILNVEDEIKKFVEQIFTIEDLRVMQSPGVEL
jgi:hypothetical protein